LVYEDETWMDLAQDCVQWRALVRLLAVLNLYYHGLTLVDFILRDNYFYQPLLGSIRMDVCRF
jgi:hypothetical protein